MEHRRVRCLNKEDERPGNVAYWMSRDQRVHDNWALLFAAEKAEFYGRSLTVFFAVDPAYPGATLRHYGFMLKGLAEVEQRLEALNIPFVLRLGSPVQEILKLVSAFEIRTLVTDFDPLRIKRSWKDDILARLNIPVYEVDAHNLVPCWIASQKEEYGAYTLRPKITRLLPEFLTDYPELTPFSKKKNDFGLTDWSGVRAQLKCDTGVNPVETVRPGSNAAHEILERFLTSGIGEYDTLRNDPNAGAQSGLSPYLHFGQISAQRIAREVIREGWGETPSGKAFLEELIIRRELSDNFCYYNPNYDNTSGFRSWAQQTLGQHGGDEREFVYSREELEEGKTHDPLWNAAQKEMILTGKMHGYMRMYWAKKILEWTESPEVALKTANELNDRYSLDGRDPNGYTGTAWSIGGIHDRAWKERPVFGKIRYMNYNGCKRKFDVDRYIDSINQIAR